MGNWHLVQRRLPLCRLASDCAPPAHRDRPRDETRRERDRQALHLPRGVVRSHDHQRISWRDFWNSNHRWFFWCLSMIPFTYIVYTLFVGLKESQESQPEACRNQVKWACWATVFSWCTYPVVYVFPMLAGTDNGKAGLSAAAIVSVQVGYTVSDIISKCGVGYLVYRIGLAKSMMEQEKYGAASNEDDGMVLTVHE